jgi:hypothetical protein
VKRFLAGFIILLMPSPAFASGWDFSVNVIDNVRILDYKGGNAWNKNNYQTGTEIRLEAKDTQWPASFMVGASGTASRDQLCAGTSNLNCKLGVSEVYAGGIGYWEHSLNGATGQPKTFLFCGIGLATVTFNGTVYDNSGSSSFTDITTAYYVNSGFMYRFGPGLNVGVDLRAGFGSKPYSTYTQYGFLVGAHW